MNFALRFVRRSLRAMRARFLRCTPRPWGYGYYDRKHAVLESVLHDPAMLRRFRSREALPDGMPRESTNVWWSIPTLCRSSVTSRASCSMPDRFSTSSTSSIANRSPEKTDDLHARAGVPARPCQCVLPLGDLRRTALRDGWFDEIVCISTLEHVGMDNTLLYTSDPAFGTVAPDTYLDAIASFDA